MNDPTSIRYARGEHTINAHIITERMAATIYRTALLTAAATIERDMSRMNWIGDGYEKADVVDWLRDRARISDEHVECVACDEANDLVKEGV